jgi:hypothetical protein
VVWDASRRTGHVRRLGASRTPWEASGCGTRGRKLAQARGRGDDDWGPGSMTWIAVSRDNRLMRCFY